MPLHIKLTTEHAKLSCSHSLLVSSARFFYGTSEEPAFLRSLKLAKPAKLAGLFGKLQRSAFLHNVVLHDIGKVSFVIITGSSCKMTKKIVIAAFVTAW